MTWLSGASQLLWQNALTAVPVVLAIALLCRALPLRPATRHSLWLLALLWFVLPVLLPSQRKAEIRATLAAAGRGAADAAVSAAAPLLMGPRLPEPDADVDRPNESFELPRPDESDAIVERVAPPELMALEHLDAPARVSQVQESEPQAIFQPQRPAGERRARADFDARSARAALRSEPASPGAARIAPAPPTAGEPAFALAADAAMPVGGVPADAVGPVPERAPARSAREWSASQWRSLAATLAPWRAWTAQVWALGLELLRMPPIPTWVWVGGAFTLIGLRVIGSLLLMRRVRRGVPAPAAIARQIADVAAAIGLRRAPRTVFVDDNVSPMVSCGLRPTLVLPVRLWRQLDRRGRKAVVYHELAHIRRGDHRVRWLEMLVCSLLWWHPLVWWTRRRLAEEAEFCCDAWVIWQMPEGRRSYAEALLRTKEYLAAARDGVPAAALGMTTGRAQRFARRLTMVMTASNRPRLSLTGVGLACTLFVASWLFTPAPATAADDKSVTVTSGATAPCVVATAGCAHDDKCSAECAKHSGAVTVWTGALQPSDTIASPAGAHVDGQHRRAQVYALPGGQAGTYVLSPGAATFAPIADPAATTPALLYTQALLAGGGGDDDDDMSELRDRLSRLESELQALSRSLEGKASARRPAPPRGAGRARAPSAPSAPGSVRLDSLGGLRALGGDGGGAESVRTYKVSNPGKAKALGDLMIRDDVPIRVSPGDSSIEVHGTPAQHEIFKAFLDMIEGKQSGSGSGAHSDAVRSLRGFLSQGDAERMAVAGKELAEAYAGTADKFRREVLEQLAAKSTMVADAAGRQRIAEALAKAGSGRRGAEDALRALRTQARAGQTEAGAIRRQAEAIEREAQGLERQIERLREKAEQLREKARSIRGDKGESREHEADAMQQSADAQAAQFEAMLAQANDMATRADQVENAAEVLESTADTIEELLQRSHEESDADAELHEDLEDEIDEATAPTPSARVEIAPECSGAPAPSPPPVTAIAPVAPAPISPGPR